MITKVQQPDHRRIRDGDWGHRGRHDGVGGVAVAGVLSASEGAGCGRADDQENGL